jgi:hypothetical protein
VAVGAKLRYEVLRRDKYTCRFCGSSAPDVHLEIDHVIPRAQGGRDIASNLQVLCDECNAGKSMTMPERWLVRETAKRQSRWQLGAEDEECPDDLSDMYAYMDAFAELAALPADHALSCVTHAMYVASPYRPTATEAILAGAKMAAEGYGALESGMPF